MAYRITESGDRRITESGDYRITEGAYIAATATLAFDATVDVDASSYPATATLAFDATVATGGDLAIQAQSTLSFGATAYHINAMSPDLSYQSENERLLSWDTTDYVEVWLDGEKYMTLDDGDLTMPASYEIRELIDVWDRPPLTIPTPLDIVELTWTTTVEDGGYFQIQRRVVGETVWNDIAQVSNTTQSYRDGPLEDGNYEYRVIAVDAEGDENSSDSVTVTVSSAPEPLSDLSLSVDSGTLTATWTASPSSDVDHYAVRVSDTDGYIDIDATPDGTPATSPWTYDVTGYTGQLAVSVRAVDSDGNEEANIGQVRKVSLIDGAEVGYPAEPRIVSADAASGASIDVEFLYDPYYEEGGPGVAYEARIYGNGGSGDIDYTSPTGTATLDYPTSAERYTYNTGALSDGTYNYDVRVATDADPDGIETTGTKVVSATVSSDTPDKPTLTGEVV